MADGLYLESGYFYVMPEVDLRPLRELFQAHVLKKILTHLNLYERGTAGQRAPPTLIKEEYIDQIEHVPYDDGQSRSLCPFRVLTWPGYEEPRREI